jgi:hypothetical protein
MIPEDRLVELLYLDNMFPPVFYLFPMFFGTEMHVWHFPCRSLMCVNNDDISSFFMFRGSAMRNNL